MADDVLASFMVALGFKVDAASQTAAKKSVADYERAVKEAEKRIEDAKWAAAKSGEDVAKLTRETNLKLAREALARAKDTEKTELEAAQKRKERNREFVSGLEKMALAATAAATAIGYAVAKVAGSFDNLYFQAQRSGTSVQSLKALSYAFSQTGGSAQQATASVDSFTTALRNNPGLRQFVKDLGVDSKLQGVDKYLATLEALRKEPYEIGVQHAEMLGISEESFNLYIRQADAIKRYRAEYDELAKRFGLNSEQAAAGSTAFQRALTRLQATIGILTEKMMASLAPAIQRVIDRFQAWVESHPGELDRILTDISNAIVAVAEGIAKFIGSIADEDGDKFIKKWDAFVGRAKTFAATVERIVVALEKVLRFWGLISTTKTVLGDGDRTVAALNAISGGSAAPGGPGGANTGNAVPPDNRTLLQKILPKSMGGQDAPRAGDGSRSWRNNNPGNIKYGPLAQRMGATGADAGGFARFPSYEAGRKAQESLLFESEGYKNKTIKEAIARWAPASDGNDPAGYAGQLAKAAGVGVDTPLASLTPEQRSKLLDAQQAKEGWIPGRASIAAGVRNGGESAPYLSGSIKLDGESYDYGSGNGTGKNSIPIGTYPITPGTIGPWGRQNNALGINNNQIWDKTLGRMRDGIEFHAASNADKLSAGCIAIAKERYEKFRAHVLQFIEKNGAAYLTVGPDGSASITATPPAKGEDGARTSQIGVPKPKMGGNPGVDANGVNPAEATRPAAPLGANSVTNSSSNDNRAVHQTINNTTTIHGAKDPKDAARTIESSLTRVHGLALANAQSAVA